MTTLTLVPNPDAPADAPAVTVTRHEPQDALRAAYAHVAEGFAQALRVHGLDATERGTLERCLVTARRRAGEVA